MTVSTGTSISVEVGSKTGMVKVGWLVADADGNKSGIAVANSGGDVGFPDGSGKYEQAKLSKTKYEFINQPWLAANSALTALRNEVSTSRS